MSNVEIQVQDKLKVTAISDLHGDFPHIEPGDVLCICGDIVPLYIQSDFTLSLNWLKNDFLNWVNSIECAYVVIVSGNHDFVFQDMHDTYEHHYSDVYCRFADYVNETIFNGTKVTYLHDTDTVIGGYTFYGTPYIPALRRWAFYQPSEKLRELFEKIPQTDIDVLLTHSPGKNVNQTGVSLQLPKQPEYGSAELTDVVSNRNIKYWFVGHVHSGNHNLTDFTGTKVANVSLKDESYKLTYEPLTVEISK